MIKAFFAVLMGTFIGLDFQSLSPSIRCEDLLTLVLDNSNKFELLPLFFLLV